MRAAELALGRSFALVFDDGNDFIKELTGFCAE